MCCRKDSLAEPSRCAEPSAGVPSLRPCGQTSGQVLFGYQWFWPGHLGSVLLFCSSVTNSALRYGPGESEVWAEVPLVPLVTGRLDSVWTDGFQPSSALSWLRGLEYPSASICSSMEWESQSTYPTAVMRVKGLRHCAQLGAGSWQVPSGCRLLGALNAR